MSYWGLQVNRVIDKRTSSEPARLSSGPERMKCMHHQADGAQLFQGSA